MSTYNHLRPDATTDFFLKHCQRQEYVAKATIIKKGDVSTDLFYIISGSVRVVSIASKGREIVLAYLNPGDYFGEICLFDEYPTRSAEVCAKTKCIIAKISYDDLKSLGDIFNKLLFNIASQLAFRLRLTSRRLGDLAFTDAQGRIARTLLDLCKQPDAKPHPHGVEIKITRKELGLIAGCSREVAGRVIKSLEQQHLILSSGKSIVIFDTH